MEEYLAVAENKGLKEIGFADHFPLELIGYKPRSPVTMRADELDDYIDDVQKIKLMSANIEVKLGVEVDYLPGKERKIEELLERYNLDYVIGSVHFLNGWDFTHPSYADHYKNMNLDSIYQQYFALVKSAINSGLFDYIGHIDIVKKFGYQPEMNLTSIYEELALLLKRSGVGLELNTAGKDAPVGQFYPSPALLKAALSEGVHISLGSDAHSPQQVARYFPDAQAYLTGLGCLEISSYNRRIRKSVVF